MMNYIIYALIFSGGLIIGLNYKKRNSVNINRGKERNYLPFRVFILICLFILLMAVAYYLHLVEPELKQSELVKIISGGLVIIGILYSILAYELNIGKNKQDIRIKKASATFDAISEWHTSPMIDYSKVIQQLEESTIFNLLKTDLNAFFVEFDKPEHLEGRRALVCVFNYFETLACAVVEHIMDERFLKRYFDHIFISYYDEYYEYVKARRIRKNNASIWIEFTNLVEKWKAQQ